MAISLIARHAFTYQDRSYCAGEQFLAEPVTAAILTRQQHARFATKDDVKVKRTYRRRDLVAEPSTD